MDTYMKIKAEVMKWGAAPGDSNAERFTFDVFEIYRYEIDAMQLRCKGKIVTISVEDEDGDKQDSETV